MPAVRRSYTFKDGLTMMAAKAIGVDPDLAAEAGEAARAAINAMRNAAKAKTAKSRVDYIRAAQHELRAISPSKHGALLNALNAKLLALQGRGGDTEVAHVAPGEVVVPREMLTPELVELIAMEAVNHGIDPRSLMVGAQGSINPETGAEEFGLSEKAKDWFTGPDKYRGLAKAGRAVGLDLAADHLEHYLDGKGAPLEVDPQRMLKYPTIQKSIGELQEYFRNNAFDESTATTTEVQAQKDKLSKLTDGETTSYTNYFNDKVGLFENLRRSMTQPEQGLDSTLSLGRHNVNGEGRFDVTRDKGLLNVKGRIDYKVDEPYNFEPDYPFVGGLIDLKNSGRANDFQTQSRWSQDVTGTVELDEQGRRLNPQFNYSTPYPYKTRVK